MSSENLSRRSFIKKTTVLAVGVSATTLFTGLVQAGPGEYGYYCVPQKSPVYKNGVIDYHVCYFEGGDAACGSVTMICGEEAEPNPETGLIGYAIAKCSENKSFATGVKCRKLPGDTPV